MTFKEILNNAFKPGNIHITKHGIRYFVYDKHSKAIGQRHGYTDLRQAIEAYLMHETDGVFVNMEEKQKTKLISNFLKKTKEKLNPKSLEKEKNI